MKVLVLSADNWEMVDEKTGKTNSGVSVWYLNDYRENTSESLGYKPSKISATHKQFEQLKSMPLPALCELSISTKPGSGGKVAIVLQDLKPLKEVKIFG